MIDLRVRLDQKDTKLAEIRRIVTVITTVVLVAYVIVSAGVVGWWTYWNRREVKVSDEVDGLLRQISDKKEAEVMVRKLDSRVKLVSTFLDERGDAATTAAVIKDGALTVDAWNYTLGGKTEVTVRGASVKDVDAYTKYLGSKYQIVTMDGVVWDAERGWVAIISYSGKKV